MDFVRSTVANFNSDGLVSSVETFQSEERVISTSLFLENIVTGVSLTVFSEEMDLETAGVLGIPDEELHAVSVTTINRLIVSIILLLDNDKSPLF
jgi:hypothetical protein